MKLREWLLEVFKQDVGGPAIEMYNWVHILFLLIIVGSIVSLYFIFRNKKIETQQLVLKIMAIVIVGLYLTDFMVHPFMYGGADELIVDKLPYHICTASGVLVGIVNVFPKQTKHIKTAVTIFGIVGAFLYVFVPTGVTGPDVMAFSYKEIQTFLYHGTLLGYGVLSLLWGDVKPQIKKCWIDAIVLVALILISLGANAAYSIPEKDIHYDWFFTTGSTFGIPAAAMPFVIFGVFFGLDLIVYGTFYLVNFIKSKKLETK